VEKDLCDFSDVTCGLAQMHQVTHRLGYGYHEGPVVEGESQRVMLSCAPGSEHFLGLTIVADFFGALAPMWSLKFRLPNPN
jgi:hypothetical protein